ncbi:sensor histidine kinase [Agathobacter sp.]
MSDYINMFLEFLYLLCNALLIFRIYEENTHSIISIPIKLLYIIVFVVLPTTIHTIGILSYFAPILFLIIIYRKSYKLLLKCLFNYIAILFLFIPIATIQTLLLNDAHFALSSQEYLNYKTTTIFILVYSIYILYTNNIKRKSSANFYSYAFSIILLGLSMLLGYITLSICIENPNSYKLIVIFSIIFLFLIICILLYDKFLAVIEENTNYRIKLELDKMEQEYSAQLDDKLNQLHSLRHDMKNHLIVIDGYASQHNDKKIHEYIHNISEDLSLTQAVDSGSHIVSALISEKEKLAKDRNINCDIAINVPCINIDDFSITTVIGNLFDNAITAAEKCTNGWIRLELAQTDSYLSILIENSYTGDIIVKNGEFASTKTDRLSPHGIGIKNVRKIVSDLNGQIDISYTDDTFHVDILLPNY